MQLRDLFSIESINLDLQANTKDEVLEELSGLLRLDPRTEKALADVLKRREELGSTGVGRGIAIPHCRAGEVSELHMAYGRKPSGIDFGAPDDVPARHFFLIVAPPLEVSSQYLTVLQKLAQFAKAPDVLGRLDRMRRAHEFLELLEQRAT